MNKNPPTSFSSSVRVPVSTWRGGEGGRIRLEPKKIDLFFFVMYKDCRLVQKNMVHNQSFCLYFVLAFGYERPGFWLRPQWVEALLVLPLLLLPVWELWEALGIPFCD